MNLKIILFVFSISFLSVCSLSPKYKKYSFEDVKLINIFLDPDVDSLMIWAAHDLASDIETITGKTCKVQKATSVKATSGIYIGLFSEALIQSANVQQVNKLKGKWESYLFKKVQGNLLIAGNRLNY